MKKIKKLKIGIFIANLEKDAIFHQKKSVKKTYKNFFLFFFIFIE